MLKPNLDFCFDGQVLLWQYNWLLVILIQASLIGHSLQSEVHETCHVHTIYWIVHFNLNNSE